MRAMLVLLIVAGIVSAYTFMGQGFSAGDQYELLADGEKYADEFVAPCDGELGSIQIWAVNHESGDIGDLTIQVYSDTQGEGPGSLLYTKHVTIPSGSWTIVAWPVAVTSFNLTPTFAVDYGQTYWLAAQPEKYNTHLVGSDTLYGEPLRFYSGDEWEPSASGSSMFIIVIGTDLGLESSTWGAIKALW